MRANTCTTARVIASTATLLCVGAVAGCKSKDTPTQGATSPNQVADLDRETAPTGRHGPVVPVPPAKTVRAAGDASCPAACEHSLRCEASRLGVPFRGYASVAKAVDLTSRQLREAFLGCVSACEGKVSPDRLACWLDVPCSGIKSASDVHQKRCPGSRAVAETGTDHSVGDLLARLDKSALVHLDDGVRATLARLFDHRVTLEQRFPELGRDLERSEDEFERRAIQRERVPKLDAQLKGQRTRALLGRYRVKVPVSGARYDFDNATWMIQTASQEGLAQAPFPDDAGLAWAPVPDVLRMRMSEEQANGVKDRVKKLTHVEVELGPDFLGRSGLDSPLRVAAFRLCRADGQGAAVGGSLCSAWLPGGDGSLENRLPSAFQADWTSPDCRSGVACEWWGQCTRQEAGGGASPECVAASEADCAKVCAKDGRCVAREGICVASSSSACAASEGCRSPTGGKRCFAVGGWCVDDGVRLVVARAASGSEGPVANALVESGAAKGGEAPGSASIATQPPASDAIVAAPVAGATTTGTGSKKERPSGQAALAKKLNAVMNGKGNDLAIGSGSGGMGFKGTGTGGGGTGGFGRIHGLGRLDAGGNPKTTGAITKLGTASNPNGDGPMKRSVVGKIIVGSGQSTGFCSKNDVASKVRSRASAIRACYESRLQVNAKLAGKLTARWTIGVDGRVTQASLGAITVPDGAVGECVLRVIRRMQFAKPEGGTCVVDWPFVFSPG